MNWVFLLLKKISAPRSFPATGADSLTLDSAILAEQFYFWTVVPMWLIHVGVMSYEAGVVRRNFGWYSVATIAGSALWCTVLAWIGVTAGQDQELMAGNVHRISLWAGGLMLFLGAIYYAFVHRHMRR